MCTKESFVTCKKREEEKIFTFFPFALFQQMVDVMELEEI